jgi:hypothetical protein
VADPALLGELALAREDLAREREARGQLEESLAVFGAQFNAKREPFERELAQLVAISNTHATKDEANFCATLDNEAQGAEIHASRFSFRRWCRSLARRSEVAAVDDASAAAA